MDDEILNTLLQADHPNACEAPPGFNWAREIKRVRALQPLVESMTRRKFEIDEYVQDSSFFTDLGTFIDERHPTGGIHRHTVLALRFSAFGGLFTAWSVCRDEDELADETIERVVGAVRQAGFVFVAAEDLQCEYTGANPHLSGTSWWIRFFDYL